MLLIDPVGSINKMFLDGTRPVPYPLFMTCFNKLLKDPQRIEPNAPSENLQEHFRAVCMALDLGIADPTGRGEDRKKEFYQHVYPVWKQALPETEFQRYQEILDGTTRRRRLEERQEEQRRQAEQARLAMEQAAAEAAKVKQGPRFADLTKAVLEMEGSNGVVLTRQVRRPTPRPARPSTPAIPGMEAAVPVHGSVEELIDALGAGEVPLQYAERGSKLSFARYAFRGENVSLQLVKTSNGYYLLLSYPRGYTQLAGAAEAVKAYMTGLGYEQTGPFFFEKTQGELTFKASLGAHSTNLAEKRGFPFTSASLARALGGLHEKLVALIEELEKELRRNP